MGIVEWKDDGFFAGDLTTFEPFDASKVRQHVPRGLYASAKCSVLIVDDFAMSGDGLDGARSRLQARGYSPDSVRTASLIVSAMAIARHRALDFYWKKVDSLDFFFPWGRAR